MQKRILSIGKILKNCHSTILKNVRLATTHRQQQQQQHTIYALASGQAQKCGVAVIRLSGNSSLQIMSKLTKHSSTSYKPRVMYFRDIWHPVTKEKLDKGLVVWFKGNSLPPTYNNNNNK